MSLTAADLPIIKTLRGGRRRALELELSAGVRLGEACEVAARLARLSGQPVSLTHHSLPIIIGPMLKDPKDEQAR